MILSRKKSHFVVDGWFFVTANFSNAVLQVFSSVIVSFSFSHAHSLYHSKIWLIFSFFASVRFILSIRHLFTIHSNHHVIHINLHTKSIILYKKLLFSGAFVISHKISTQNIFVTEFNEFTDSNNQFAVSCNHWVFCKNCSGLSSIQAISAVVLGLFTTFIFQISCRTFCFSCNDTQNSKFSSSDSSNKFQLIKLYGENPGFKNSLLFRYALNFKGSVNTADFSGLRRAQLCTDR